jgi:major type 1 subunit fimbrin (pilin)
MKKTLLSAALIAGFGVAAIAPQAARATDGTITFNGKVLSSTCTVSNASGGVVTVTLPDVVKTAFTTSGSTAGLTPFSLNLTGCPTTPSGVVVGATFTGNSNIDGTTGAIQNPTTAGYSNVEVQMTNASGSTPFNLNTTPNPVSTSIDGSGNATLSYAARYYQPTSTAITAGTVNTSVTFTLTYN